MRTKYNTLVGDRDKLKQVIQTLEEKKRVQIREAYEKVKVKCGESVARKRTVYFSGRFEQYLWHAAADCAGDTEAAL